MPANNQSHGVQIDGINDYRTIWPDSMENFPEKTKTELRRIAQAEYTWLYRHNRLWLDEHSPTTAPKKGDDRRVDWKKRGGTGCMGC